MKAFRVTAALAAILAVYSTSGNAGSSTAGGPIEFRLGLLIATTGADAQVEGPIEEAAKLAIDEVNARGKVKLTYEVADIGDTPAAAVNAVNVLLGKEIAALITTPKSTVNFAIADAIKQAKIPALIGGSADSLTKGNETYFRLRPSNVVQATGAAEFMTKSGRKRPCIIYAANELGQGGADTIGAQLKSKGIPAVSVQSYSPTAATVEPQLLKLKQASCDFIVSWSDPVASAQTMRERVRLGITAPLIMSSGASTILNLVKKDESNGVYMIGEVPPLDRSADPATQAFVKAYQQRFRKMPNFVAATYYDGVKLLGQAVEKANSVDPKAVIAEIRKLTYQGVAHKYVFSGEARGAQDITVLQVKDGALGLPK